MTSHQFDFHPVPNPQRKEQDIRQAVRAFRQQEEAGPQASSLWMSLLGQWKPFAAGAVMAAVIVCIVLSHTYRSVLVQHPAGNAEELALLSEMKNLFGDKLQAVVQDNGHIEPVVSTSSNFTDAQPVMITLTVGGKEIRIISFSGNTVTLHLDNKNLSLSPTVTSDGKVIVEGKDFMWSHGETLGVSPGTLQAKTLGTSL